MSGSNHDLEKLVENCYERMDAEIKAWKSAGKISNFNRKDFSLAFKSR